MNQAILTDRQTDNQHKAGAAYDISRKEAAVYLISGAVISLLYTVCFTGQDIYPQLSFALFCPATFLILSLALHYMGYLKNKKAILWAVPIVIASVYNVIFDLNIFTYGNVLLMHLMFAVYTALAIREQPFELFGLSSAVMLLRIGLSNSLVIFDVPKKLTGNKQSKSSNATLKKIMIGALIALPVLFVITGLLVSADMVFGKLTEDILYKIFDFKPLDISFPVTFVIVLAYTVGYVYQSKRVCEAGNQYNLKCIRADVIISATFLILVNLVFLMFSVIQIAYLFGGGLMELPEGMVYSQYAREGFFQLLFVTVINFSVIFIFINLFSSVSDSKPLRILLLMLCVFTGVLIASSFYRMYLYIEVYGHTVLRLWVITFLVMEVVLILITVCKLLNDKTPYVKWFFLTVFVFYFIVNVTGSDYFVTRLNVSNFLSGKHESVDVNSVGADGLRLIKPLMENELYVCVDNKIRTKSDISYGKNTNIQTYEDVVRHKYQKDDYWQNWSALKSK